MKNVLPLVPGWLGSHHREENTKKMPACCILVKLGHCVISVNYMYNKKMLAFTACPSWENLLTVQWWQLLLERIWTPYHARSVMRPHNALDLNCKLFKHAWHNSHVHSCYFWLSPTDSALLPGLVPVEVWSDDVSLLSRLWVFSTGSVF